MKPLASIASNRLETWIRRISSAALLVSGLEVIANANAQSDYMTEVGPLALALVVGSAACFLVAAVLADRSRPWGLIHGLMVLAVVWAVPLTHAPGFSASEFERPWVWWSVGMAMVLVATTHSGRVWAWFLPLASGSWVWAMLQPTVSARPQDAWLDGSYLLVFTLALVGLVTLVRAGAAEVDRANSDAIKSALTQARTDAVERERQRLDALVHDQVLHTLILVARADSAADRVAASQGADAAIKSLMQAQEGVAENSEVSSLGLFRAIERAAEKLDNRIVANSSGASASPILPAVAQALTEACLQALDNAIQHSNATEIALALQGLPGGHLLFSVKDNGSGFRQDRVPRSRIGISTSIRARVESVGGDVKIISSPGEGTEVVMRWPSD